MHFSIDILVEMKGLELGSRHKAFIIVGLVIASLGFGMHFIQPGFGRSGFIILIDPMSSTTESISLSSGSVDQNFQFDFLGPAHPNLTIYFLEEPDYDQYVSGTPLDNLSAQITLDENGRAATTFTLLESDMNLISVATSVLTLQDSSAFNPTSARSLS